MSNKLHHPLSNVISKRTDFTFKLEAAGKAKASGHSATLVRPETEAEFYEMSHLFIMTVIAIGLASATIVIKFIDDVVFATIRMKEPFAVAHELLLLYFREMDFDPAHLLHMGNVFRRGGQDTLLSEDRHNAAAFFRTCGANPRVLKGATDVKTEYPKPDAKPNGKDDSSSKKPCPDFNAGRPCKKLKPDGTCVYCAPVQPVRLGQRSRRLLLCCSCSLHQLRLRRRKEAPSPGGLTLMLWHSAPTQCRSMGAQVQMAFNKI